MAIRDRPHLHTPRQRVVRTGDARLPPGAPASPDDPVPTGSAPISPALARAAPTQERLERRVAGDHPISLSNPELSGADLQRLDPDGPLKSTTDGAYIEDPLAAFRDRLLEDEEGERLPGAKPDRVAAMAAQIEKLKEGDANALAFFAEMVRSDRDLHLQLPTLAALESHDFGALLTQLFHHAPETLAQLFCHATRIAQSSATRELAVFILGRSAGMGCRSAGPFLRALAGSPDEDLENLVLTQIGSAALFDNLSKTDVQVLANAAFSGRKASDVARAALVRAANTGNIDAQKAFKAVLQAENKDQKIQPEQQRAIFSLAHEFMQVGFLDEADLDRLEELVFPLMETGKLKEGTVAADALTLFDDLREGSDRLQSGARLKNLLHKVVEKGDKDTWRQLIRLTCPNRETLFNDVRKTLIRKTKTSKLERLAIDLLKSRSTNLVDMERWADIASELNTKSSCSARDDYDKWLNKKLKADAASKTEALSTLVSLASKAYHADTACLAARAAELCYEPRNKLRETAATWGYQDVKPFHDAGTDADGFVAVTGDHIMLSFRGSEEMFQKGDGQLFSQDWKQNFDTDAVDAGPWGEGKIHEGFLEQIESVWPKVEAALAAHPDKPILISGHSLGGALSVLAASRLARSGRKIAAVYTFGQPKVGNRKFLKTFMAEVEAPLVRVRNRHDVVPTVPPGGAFTHAEDIFETFWFDKRGRLRRVDAGKGLSGALSGGVANHDKSRYRALTEMPYNKIPRS